MLLMVVDGDENGTGNDDDRSGRSIRNTGLGCWRELIRVFKE